jgi:hypothetical protein
MSETMRAIEISEPGGPEVLRPTTRPVPEPMAEQILIAVDHAGVNRPTRCSAPAATPRPPAHPICRGWRPRASWPASVPASRAGRKGMR